MLQMYLKASNSLRACQTRSLSKVIKQESQSKREVRSSKQMFEVLSISSHAGVQSFMQLVDGLVDNALLQTRPCGNQALHPSFAIEQHLSWYSTIEKISLSNK